MAKRIGTQGTAPFVIQDTGIPSPAGHSDHNVGGPFHVATLADLKAIPSYYLIDKSVEGVERPVWGAMGYVHSDETPENNGRWELKKGLVDNDITNPDNWQKMETEGGTSETPESIKTKYESNEDTNAFTDAEKLKLGNIEVEATKNEDTDDLPEGENNKYFTEARVVGSKLAGYVKAETVEALSSSKSVIEALQILEKALDGKVTLTPGGQLVVAAEKNRWNDTYTKAETDNKIAEKLNNLVWRDAVENASDLPTAYPDAVEGWAAIVNSENALYRFNGTSWGNIGNFIIPKATASVDGLMSKEDFVKLRDIEAEATKNDNTDELDEGTTNKYFTEARAVAAKIAGYVKAEYSAPLAEADSVLQALGKLERLLDDRLSIEGENYVCIIPGPDPEANGTRLIAAYNAAKSKTPGGNPLSANNRYTVIPFPGEYLLFSTGSAYLEQLQLAEYVDLIGFGEGVYFGSASTSGITQAVNDVRLANFRFRKNGQFIYVNTSDTSKSIYKNLAVAFSSWGFDAVFNGIYEDIDASFSAGFGLFYTDGSISGTFRNIIGELRGNYGFDGAYIENCTVAQTFKNSFLRNVKIGSQDFVLDNSVLVQSSLNGNIYVKSGSEIYHCNIAGDITRDMEGEIGDPSFNVKMFGNYCSGSVDAKLTNLIINGHNSWDSEGGGGIEDIIEGTNTSIDKTNPKKPVINFTGGDGYETPEEVRDALSELTGENRLDASAIKNLPQGFSGSWDDLTGKPSLFPPAAHTHDIEDIIGLSQELLDIHNEIHTNANKLEYVLNFSNENKLTYDFEETIDIKITSVKVEPGSGQIVDLGDYTLGDTLPAWEKLTITVNKVGVIELIGERVQQSPSEYFVRPSGTIYGGGDGNSYEDAWSGFTNIDWESISDGSTLYICGTHNEALTIGKSNIIISGGYVEESGLIDCQNLLNSGIIVTDKTNVVINNLTSLRAVVNGILIQGNSEVITNDCEFSETGNQGIQHLGNAKGTHNNATCNDNVDDGISGHDDAIIIVNGGQFKRNESGINVVHSVNLTVNDSPSFEDNSLNDIWTANATTEGSCVGIINNCTLNIIQNTSGAHIIMNECIINEKSVNNNSYLVANKCVISNIESLGSTSISEYNDSLILSVTNLGNYSEFNRSRVYCAKSVGGTLKARHTLFDGSGESAMILDIVSGGTLDIRYCVFKNIPETRYGVAVRNGSLSAIVDNCTFVGEGNIGRGTFAATDVTLNNNIYIGLETGHQRTGGSSVVNNSCFYDCTNNTLGTVTINDSITSDPLLADAINEDYSLLGGSPCINSGLDTGESEGILTANWGDEDNLPVVTAGNQGENYNIGAYV